MNIRPIHNEQDYELALKTISALVDADITTASSGRAKKPSWRSWTTLLAENLNSIHRA